MSECHASDLRKEELRCICNRLLFMQKGEDIEIKCPKCKRIVVIHTKGVKSITFE